MAGARRAHTSPGIRSRMCATRVGGKARPTLSRRAARWYACVVCPVRAGMPVWAGMRSARRRIGVCTTFSSKKDFPLRAKGVRICVVACLYASILAGPVKPRVQTCGPGVSTGGTATAAAFQVRRGVAGGSPPRPGAAEDGPIASKPRSFFRLCLCQRPAGAGGLRGPRESWSWAVGI